MISPKVPEILYGGDYNPEQWPPEIWEEDAALMREAGLNLVTVGVFSWSRLNPGPGIYEFDWLDRVMDLLHGHGIHVCLATATANPPVWLGIEHPESLPTGPDGVRHTHGSRHCFTPNSAAYREHAGQLVRRIAERYGRHPALALWHVGNEPGGGAVPYSRGEEDAVAFRRWLRAKYGRIEDLRAAWNTAFWSQDYRDWDEIQPPRRTPAAPNPTQALDFKRFYNDAYRDLYLMEKAILEEVAPGVPITTNFPGVDDNVIDPFSWAADLDFAAVDLYPDPDPAFAPDGFGLDLDLTRSLKGKPFVLMEQAATQIHWKEVNANKRPGIMRLWSYQAIARGADGVMFFQWRQSTAGAEKFHSAMLPAGGGARSRIFAEVRRLGAELKKLAPVLGTTVRADCALIFDWPSRWALDAPSLPRRFDYLAVFRDFHRAFRALNLPVDIVPASADFSRYKVVLAPLLYILKAGDAERLSRFVHDGGIFVGSFFSGIVDENDHLQTGGYPKHLREMLGLWVEEWEPTRDPTANAIRMEDGRLVPCGYLCERVHLETASTLGVFANDFLAGGPALTVNDFGKGRAFYIATRTKASFYRYALGELMDQAGLERPLRDPPEEVEVCLREGANGRFLFLLNHSAEEREVDLGTLAGTGLLQGKRVGGRITLAGLDVAVIQLDAGPRAGVT